MKATKSPRKLVMAIRKQMSPGDEEEKPTRYHGQATLLTNSERGKAISLIGNTLTVWIPVTKEDAEQLGMEKEWKASAKAGRHFHWRMVLHREEK